MESPVGRIVLVSNDTHLKSLSFSNEQVDEPDKLPEILLRTVHQLTEYFAGTRFMFDLDIDPDGSGFQKLVWQQLLKVPFGSTKSYREVAVSLGSALNTRAVGTANGKIQLRSLFPVTGSLEVMGKWLVMPVVWIGKNGCCFMKHNTRSGWSYSNGENFTNCYEFHER